MYAMWRQGLLPASRCPGWLWLVIGGIVGLGIFFGLYRWQNVWFARVVWAVHGLRLPALIKAAFFAGEAARLPSIFYLTAMVVVVINLWMLARAAWDL